MCRASIFVPYTHWLWRTCNDLITFICSKECFVASNPISHFNDRLNLLAGIFFCSICLLCAFFCIRSTDSVWCVVFTFNFFIFSNRISNTLCVYWLNVLTVNVTTLIIIMTKVYWILKREKTERRTQRDWRFCFLFEANVFPPVFHFNFLKKYFDISVIGWDKRTNESAHIVHTKYRLQMVFMFWKETIFIHTANSLWPFERMCLMPKSA